MGANFIRDGGAPAHFLMKILKFAPNDIKLLRTVPVTTATAERSSTSQELLAFNNGTGETILKP